MVTPRVSVVIATYRREGVLCDTVEQVLSEDYPDFEVIVVDQTEEHEAETDRRLGEWSGRIRHIRLDEANLTHAENVGIREATGEVVLFLDDDVRITRGLIAAHAANYADETWAGVAGMVTHDDRPPTDRLPRVCRYSKAGWFLFIHNYRGRVEVKVAPGGNMSFRRDVLLKVGGIDEGLSENAIHWEIDLCRRIAAIGGRVVHDPLARVHHLRHGAGGVRMGRSRPGSFFENYVRVVWRHVGRHERWVLVWRLFRDHVVVGSGLCPVAMAVMSWRLLRALWGVVTSGPAEPRPGLLAGSK